MIARYSMQLGPADTPMQPAHRIMIGAVAVLLGAASAGMVWAFVPPHDIGNASIEVLPPSAPMMTASLPPISEVPEDRHARLAFVSAPLALKQSLFWQSETAQEAEDPVLVAAHPDSWAVEVERRPHVYATKPKRDTSPPVARKPKKRHYTLQDRLAEIGPAATARLVEKYAKASAPWPPKAVAFVAIKDQKVIELHSQSQDGKWAFVHSYPVLAASGGIGPKLRRGDKQVPEGVYRITYLNPNSAYHVSMRVNYPNAFDRQMAAKDGRKDLGGDIMIHGKNVSAGCLAVGDPAAEELFVLGAEVGISNIKLVIAPTDLRKKEIAADPTNPSWVPKLHAEVASAMSEFKGPPDRGLLALLGL